MSHIVTHYCPGGARHIVKHCHILPHIAIQVVHDRTQINRYQPSEAEGLKDQGNAAYKDGRFSEAIRLYRY